VSSRRVADADEDVGVPSENFSPCPRASVRGLPRRRASEAVFEFFGLLGLALKRLEVGPNSPVAKMMYIPIFMGNENDH
jgi:hypothetical protein